MNAIRLIGMYLMLCGIFGFLVSFLSVPATAQLILFPFFLFSNIIKNGIMNAYGGNIFTDWMVSLWADVAAKLFSLVICFLLGYLFMRISEPKVIMKR